MKKILIINKNGFVGSGLHEELSAEYVVGGVSNSGKGQNTRQLEIADKYAVNNFFRDQSFDVIVYCPKTEMWDSNQEGNDSVVDHKIKQTNNIVNATKRKEAKFIYISSKDVYGGDDPPYRTGSERSPVNHYGKACLESEYAVQEKLKNYCIIRPGNIYGFTESKGYDKFTRGVVNSDGTKKMGFDDEVVEYPTLIDDLIDLVRKVINHDLTSNYNISSSRGVTNYEWAKIVCDVHNIDTELIAPKESSQQSNRPYNVRFDLESITDLGLSVMSIKQGLERARMQNLCTFRPIYIQALDDRFGDRSSSSIRHKLGNVLAERDKMDVDAVVPIPDSGIYPASGYANRSDAPLKFALSKQNLRHRTLYDTGIDRSEVLEDAMQPIPNLVADKTIVLVDEAILSGTTVKSVLAKLNDAKEVHLRISSPPIVRPCPAGIYPNGIDLLVDEIGDLEDENLSTIEERLTKELEVSSTKFIPTDVYSNIVEKPEGSCTYCFN